MAGFQTARSLPGIRYRPRVAMGRRAEAHIRAGGGHMEHV
jgi:hypothetical protein